MRRATAAIKRAYVLDPRDPKILCEMGYQHALNGDLSGAYQLLCRAADLGRNQADAASLLANAFSLAVDKVSDARTLLHAALRLNPFPPVWYTFTDCRISYYQCDFTRCRKVAQTIPNMLTGALYGTLAAAMQGDIAAARHARDHLIAIFAGFDAEGHARSFPICAPQALSLFREGVERLDALA